MQHITPYIGDAFVPVKKLLKEAFILALFQGLREVTPGRGVTRLPVKQTLLALPEPTKTSPENWTASCVIKGHVVAAFRGQEEFRAAYHQAYLREGRDEVQKRNFLKEEEALVETLTGAPIQDSHCLWWATKKGE